MSEREVDYDEGVCGDVVDIGGGIVDSDCGYIPI